MNSCNHKYILSPCSIYMFHMPPVSNKWTSPQAELSCGRESETEAEQVSQDGGAKIATCELQNIARRGFHMNMSPFCLSSFLQQLRQSCTRRWVYSPQSGMIICTSHIHMGKEFEPESHKCLIVRGIYRCCQLFK